MVVRGVQVVLRGWRVHRGGLVQRPGRVHIVSLWGDRSDAGNINLMNQMKNTLMEHAAREPVVCIRRYPYDKDTGEVTSVKTTVTPETARPDDAAIILHLFDVWSVDGQARQTAMTSVKRQVVTSAQSKRDNHVFVDEATLE